MTRGELGSAVFKVAGILILVKAIPILSAIFQFFTLPSAGISVAQRITYYLACFVPPVVYIVIGLFLIWRSRDLAASVFGVPEQKITFALDVRDVQSVAFSVIGIYLIVQAFPEILRYLYSYYQLRGIAATPASIEAKGAILSNSLQFLFGIGLFLSGGRISNIWGTIQAMRPMRDAGNPRENSAEKSDTAVSQTDRGTDV